MGIQASAQWWVRAGGDALNGGGYDAEIAGAGTNYCDQDAAQLSLTDLATPGAGSTTLTSATGGFTAAMVGNCVRIPTGTNFQAGYYFVTVYTDANTVTLDRTPTSGGTGSGGTGRLGGAFATPWGSLSTGGAGFTAPAVTSPLAAGHIVNLRGGGTDTPGSADYTIAGYAMYPSGSTAAGRIKWLGYNGRPRIDFDDLAFNAVTYHTFEHLMFVMTAATDPAYGFANPPTSGPSLAAIDVRIDQAGYDKTGIAAFSVILNCEFVNSGSASAGSYQAIRTISGAATYEANWVGNKIDGWRGGGMHVGYVAACIENNLILNTKAIGIEIVTTADYGGRVAGNTIYGNTGDGIKITTAHALHARVAINNILDSNGGYGINVSVGSVALNDRTKALIDYNAFRNNTSGAVNGISAGDNDITLSADPFTNAAGGDFTLNNTAGGGADLRGVAFPTSIP